MGSDNAPNIFEYLEYRKYLFDFYRYMKAKEEGFTYRLFSQRAGMAAPNFLQLLILGKRNLKESSIGKVSTAIGHSSAEALYFRHCVLFVQSSSSQEKETHFQRLTELREPRMRIDLVSNEQLSHYKHWYYHAIRELLGFYELRPSERYAFRHLAAMLKPAISESQARNAVKDLLKLGLLREGSGGCIEQSSRFISTGDEVRSFFVRSFHETMMKAALKSQDRFQPELRDVSSLTVSVSDTGFKTIKSRIQQFRKELLEVVNHDSAPSNVYQINFQLFPLTNPKKTAKYLQKRRASLALGGREV